MTFMLTFGMQIPTLSPLALLHAGALELRNYPTALRNLETPLLHSLNSKGAGQSPTRLLDMGAVDVWRSRESRIPLFNDYLKVCCEQAVICQSHND